MTAPETIAAAAIQIDGVTISLPRPARHAQVMQSAEAFLGEYSLAYACQGFVTSHGRFVNRVEAKMIAHRAGQPTVREDMHPRDAFSEDFW